MSAAQNMKLQDSTANCKHHVV